MGCDVLGTSKYIAVNLSIMRIIAARLRYLFCFQLYCVFSFPYLSNAQSGAGPLQSPGRDLDPANPSWQLTDIGSYPLLKKGTRYTMQSSYDRSGGNEDGFNGTYSVIGHQNGNAILSALDGPGMITRIWFPIDRDYPDVPMGLRNKRIFIYLDGNDQPVIDMPIINLFNHTDPRFPYPLCGMALGGCWCHVPMPFRKSARIVVEGEKANFFHVEYNRYGDAGKIKTFTLAESPWTLDAGKLMDPLWNPGDPGYLVGKDTISLKSVYRCHPGSNTLRLPEGPAILRALIIKGSEDDLEKMLEGRIRIAWDDDKTPAIDVPLSLFFAREKSGLNTKNLLAGTLPGGGGVYNFFPMPYRHQAHAELVLPQNCRVAITTLFEKPAVFDEDLCYLHIQYAREYPTTPGKRFVWLDTQGEGHYAGVYLRAAGPSLGGSANTGTVYWTACLEGDEVFEVNGEMIDHGTGTEDYFNAGWNGLHGKLDHAEVFPFHGFTLFDAAKDSSRIAAFRWHLPTEVVPFNGHFQASIEVGPQDDLRGNYESIAYYYLRKP